MRWICFVVASCFAAGVTGAAEVKLPPAGGGPSAKEAQQGFVRLFDGKTLEGWQGNVDGYAVENGVLVCKKHGGGNLFTKKQYDDFVLRFEYKLEPGGNNGVGIRAPLEGTPAFTAMEIQILDDSFPEYKTYMPVQFNGAIYGAVAPKLGHMKKVGQWNAMEIMAKGPRIRVTLNGAVIVDADVSKLETKRIHGYELTGLTRRRGHIALCGHGHRVEFRNLRVKRL